MNTGKKPPKKKRPTWWGKPVKAGSETYPPDVAKVTEVIKDMVLQARATDRAFATYSDAVLHREHADLTEQALHIMQGLPRPEGLVLMKALALGVEIRSRHMRLLGVTHRN